MNYKLFGQSGLRVSELCLGTMGFGTKWKWGADKELSQKIFDAYANAGGNFIDTANRYTEGTSEKFVGDFIAKDRDHFIGGEWVAPANGEYFDNISPIDGKAFTKAARGNKQDIDKALDAAHKAFATWSKTSAAERGRVLLAICRCDGKEPRAVGTYRNGRQRQSTPRNTRGRSPIGH